MPLEILTFLVPKPTKLKINVSFSFAEMLNFPSKSVTVLLEVPSIKTETPGSESPSDSLLIVPLTVLSEQKWAAQTKWFQIK